MTEYTNIIKNDVNALIQGTITDFPPNDDSYEIFGGEDFGSYEYYTKNGTLLAIDNTCDSVIYFPVHSAPYSRGYDVFGNTYLLTYYRFKELRRDFAESYPAWMGKATFRGAIAKPYETR